MSDLNVSKKYIRHARWEFIERAFFSFIPTAQGRVKWLRKHKKLAMIGDHVHWQPRKYPTDGQLLKIHNNVAIATGVEFIMHDIINWVIDGVEGSRVCSGYSDCIEICDNVFIGAGVKILPGVKIGENVF